MQLRGLISLQPPQKSGILQSRSGQGVNQFSSNMITDFTTSIEDVESKGGKQAGFGQWQQHKGRIFLGTATAAKSYAEKGMLLYFR